MNSFIGNPTVWRVWNCGSAFVAVRLLYGVSVEAIHSASVVLAAERGYLSLDDEVRKYIPELPDYGHVITVRQMIHQTCGFQDRFSLLLLSGHDEADFDSPEDIFKIVVRQRGLNNVPGDEWIYSNTNYFLLGVVVKRATQKRTFRIPEN